MTLDDDMTARAAETLDREHYESEAFTDAYGLALQKAQQDHAAKPHHRQRIEAPALDDPDWCAMPGQTKHDTSGFTTADFAELRRRQRDAVESDEAADARWDAIFAADPHPDVEWGPRLGQRGRRVAMPREAS